MLARLIFNADLARQAGRIDPTVEIHPIDVAVGDTEGEGHLSMHGSEGGRSLLCGTGRPVPIRRLAGLLDELDVARADVVKIDVEGYEDRVLVPYLDSAKADRYPRSIIMEHVHGETWQVDCIAACRRHGYSVVLTTRGNIILRR